MAEKKKINGVTYEHKEMFCLVCQSEKDEKIVVDNTSDKLAHEKEYDHSIWSKDWEGHWNKVEK